MEPGMGTPLSQLSERELERALSRIPVAPDIGKEPGWVDNIGAIREIVQRNGWPVPIWPELEPDPPPSSIPYRTALSVAAGTSEHPDWLVPGFVALQAITELDGKIKSSGKTTWATHLVAAVLDGERFMGYLTTRTNVVYLTEQTEGSFREALSRAGLIARGDELRIVFRRDISAMRWVDLITAVATDALRDGYGLLVVDTVGKLASLVDENEAGAAAAMMVPLQNAAADGMAVLVCRHERKSGGEVGESGRGSSAISGDVDVILQMRRPEGKQPLNRRVIECLSRYSETPEKIVIELTEEGYILLGDEEAVAMADSIRIVSGVLNEFDRKEGLSMDELVEASEDDSGQTRLDRIAVRRALHELMYRGDVEQTGLGRKGSPFRFRLNALSGHSRSPKGERREVTGNLPGPETNP